MNITSALIQRFNSHVEKTDKCWLWTGAKSPTGYGKFNVFGTVKQAHRVSYEIHKGPIPAGNEVDHLCSVRHCVNPEHLEAVSHTENLNRGKGNGRAERTHCPDGHRYTPENTWIDKRGARNCKQCRKNRRREHYLETGKWA